MKPIESLRVSGDLATTPIDQIAPDLAPEEQAEIERFRIEIARLEAGETDPDDFKKFRLQNGVYGIRGIPDEHMIRVKIRYGNLTPHQLETFADIADEFTPLRIGHITTRQDIQFHNIKRRHVPEILLRIALSGLTTREACGNTVRNVTSCPYSGIHPDEVFDVTPYADALALHLLRNPINQNLPRKFKIAFEGCLEDHARTPIHDLGCVAAIRETAHGAERGFRIYVGGGLGAQPMAAQLLEDFTPAHKLIPTAEAVIRVFDRHGERRSEQVHRMRARLKFLIKAWGFEKIRREILIERRAILATRSGLANDNIEPVEEWPPDVSVNETGHYGRERDLNYKKWLESNVLRQKQPGWCAVTVR
jgi:sulfite reductase beta subunit-like hemoprotein